METEGAKLLRRGSQQRRHGDVESGGDGAEELGFGDEDLAIGADDVGAGGDHALADRKAGGGKLVEGGVERADVAVGGIEQCELGFDQLDLGGADSEGLLGADGAVVGDMGHRGEDDGDFGDEGVK